MSRHQLYAMEFANGLIKVGVSRRPAHRRIELQRQYRCPITRMQAVAHAQGSNAFVAEQELLCRMRRIGVSVRAEVFASVPFGAAVTLIKQMTSREFESAYGRRGRRMRWARRAA